MTLLSHPSSSVLKMPSPPSNTQTIHLTITPRGGGVATKKAIAAAMALKEKTYQVSHVNSNTAYSGVQVGL